VSQEGTMLKTAARSKAKLLVVLVGMIRALLNNMVVGVS
jgi:ribosomal protein L6P/L9E